MYLTKKDKIKTKEALMLLYDPTKLFKLLYSKYGNIEDDVKEMHINSLVYDKSCHYLIVFKELQYTEPSEEFLRRYYYYSETNERLPKLCDYYKNYLVFFCRPMFNNFTIIDLMRNYSDCQAELFYKYNYCKDFKGDDSSKKSKSQSNESSISSIDNMTNNKTIFDKRTRNAIENNCTAKTNDNEKNDIYTITLESSRMYNENNGLNSRRSKNNSFAKMISGIMEKKKENKKVKPKVKNNAKMKGSLCALTKLTKLSKFTKGKSTKENDGGINMMLSPKNNKSNFTKIKSRIVEFNKNKRNTNTGNQIYKSKHVRNKTSYINNWNSISNNVNHILRSGNNSNFNIGNRNSSRMVNTISNMNTVSYKIMNINCNGNNNGRAKGSSNSKNNNKNNRKQEYIFNTIAKRKTRNSSEKMPRIFSLNNQNLPNSNSKKINGRLNPSSSIPKYLLNPHTISAKDNNNNDYKNSNSITKNEIKHKPMLSGSQSKRNKCKIQSQRTTNTNNSSNDKRSPSTIITSQKKFVSRNKMIFQRNGMQSLKSLKSKNSSIRNSINSIDEKKMTITKNNSNRSKKLNQHNLENLIRKAKFSYAPNSSMGNVRHRNIINIQSQSKTEGKKEINQLKMQNPGKYINVNINTNLWTRNFNGRKLYSEAKTANS